MNSIDVKTISKTFGRGASTYVALDAVSLRVPAGKVIALVGESGSGKSTLARVVMGLETPDNGMVLLRSETSEEPVSIKRVQMVFQDPFASLNPVHRIRTHLERPVRKLRADITTPTAVDEEVSRLLEVVGLTPAETFLDRFPGSLSGGQRQRVAIARALAARPEFLVADEPTSMLDVSLRGEILNLLKTLRSQGLGILLITHDLKSVRAVSDDVYVLHRGQIVEHGPTGDVLSDPQHPYTQSLLNAVPDAHGHFLSVTHSGGAQASTETDAVKE